MSLIDTVENIVFETSRSFGDFGYFDLPVFVEEVGIDELETTHHPVEQGATVSDHAYKKQAQLRLTMAWSSSGVNSLAAFMSNALDSTFSPNYVRDIYQKLLDLQASREPFTITTGKRRYYNMLLKHMSQPTNNKTENALIITAYCEEVLITQTNSISLSDNQAAPQETTSTSDQGTKQLSDGITWNE